jgi:hypothetical protein
VAVADWSRDQYWFLPQTNYRSAEERMVIRKRLTFLVAAFSAALFVAILVFWTGPVTTCVFYGWNRLAESTPDRLVIDNYTIQAGRGGLWIGKCRFSVEAMILNLKDFRDHAEKFLAISQRVDVFTIEGVSPPLSGIGRQSRTTTEPAALNLLLRFELDGVLLPPWVLLLVTGIGPTLWIVRRVSRAWQSSARRNRDVRE